MQIVSLSAKDSPFHFKSFKIVVLNAKQAVFVPKALPLDLQ